MNPIRRLNGGFVSYELPGAFPESELERPSYMTEDEARRVGWVIDRLDGHTRPTTKHPAGRCRWVSGPVRPTDTDTAMAEVKRSKEAARRQWEDDGSQGVYEPPTYRIRNLYTGD